LLTHAYQFGRPSLYQRAKYQKRLISLDPRLRARIRSERQGAQVNHGSLPKVISTPACDTLGDDWIELRLLQLEKEVCRSPPAIPSTPARDTSGEDMAIRIQQLKKTILLAQQLKKKALLEREGLVEADVTIVFTPKKTSEFAEYAIDAANHQ